MEEKRQGVCHAAGTLGKGKLLLIGCSCGGFLLVLVGLLSFLSYLLSQTAARCFDPNNPDAASCNWKCTMRGDKELGTCDWCSHGSFYKPVCVSGLALPNGGACESRTSCSACVKGGIESDTFTCGEGRTMDGLGRTALISVEAIALVFVCLMLFLGVFATRDWILREAFEILEDEIEDSGRFFGSEQTDAPLLFEYTEEEPIQELRIEQAPQDYLIEGAKSKSSGLEQPQQHRSSYSRRAQDPEAFVQDTFRKWGYD